MVASSTTTTNKSLEAQKIFCERDDRTSPTANRLNYYLFHRYYLHIIEAKEKRDMQQTFWENCGKLVLLMTVSTPKLLPLYYEWTVKAQEEILTCMCSDSVQQWGCKSECKKISLAHALDEQLLMANVNVSCRRLLLTRTGCGSNPA